MSIKNVYRVELFDVIKNSFEERVVQAKDVPTAVRKAYVGVHDDCVKTLHVTGVYLIAADPALNINTVPAFVA